MVLCQTLRKRNKMNPGIYCKEENRRQGIRLNLSRGLNSSSKNATNVVPQHPDIMFFGTSEIFNLLNPPSMDILIHSFDSTGTEISPRIPYSLFIGYSISLLKKKGCLAATNSWIVIIIISDLYFYNCKRTYLCHSLLIDLFYQLPGHYKNLHETFSLTFPFLTFLIDFSFLTVLLYHKMAL